MDSILRTAPDAMAAHALQQRLDRYQRKKLIRIQVLIENEYRIRKELEEIETKRRLLETKLDTNLKQRQRTDPEAEELIRELMAMERSRSYPICEAMQQYLPRELRDMIYKHVIGPAEWHNNNHTVPILESNNPARPYVVLTGSMQDLWGILRRDGYITHQTRRELLECWYKTCTFDFATDVHLIRAFFERDAALYRFLKLGLPALNLVCQLEIDVPRDVLMDEARFNETLGRTLRGLALLKRPARLRLNLDTYFKISTPPKAYEPSRFKYLGEPDPIARGEVFKKLSQLLPSLTGWKIELVVEVWTLPQKHNMENIIGHGKLGDDLCSGFEVQMMLPGLAEFSHSQSECLFHKLCCELDQYYDNTLIEFYDGDSDYPSSDGSTSSEDGTEDDSDDDYWEQSELTEYEIVNLRLELELCANEDLSIPPMHYY